MDARAFEDHVLRFGGDLGRWPPGLAADARALLAGSADARTLHAEVTTMEHLLGPAAPSGPLSASEARMAALAMRHAQRDGPLRAARRATWGAAAGAALTLGLVIGAFTVTSPEPHDDSLDRVVASALDTAPAATGDVPAGAGDVPAGEGASDVD